MRADPSRIAAQIVTGIGFLGAGVIFRQGLTVRGLTTAASLWLVAAVGMAAGAGFWEGAVIATIIALASLRPLEWAKERVLPRRSRGMLTIQLAEGASAGPALEALERRGQVRGLRQAGVRLEVDFDLGASSRAQVLGEVAELSQVVEARWTA